MFCCKFQLATTSRSFTPPHVLPARQILPDFMFKYFIKNTEPCTHIMYCIDAVIPSELKLLQSKLDTKEHINYQDLKVKPLPKVNHQ